MKVRHQKDSFFLFCLKLNHQKGEKSKKCSVCKLNSTKKGWRGLTIAGGCSCVSGLGLLLLLPELKLDDGKAGSDMLASAVPALLGIGDGLINLQVM